MGNHRPDDSVSVRDLLIETRSDVKDVRKRIDEEILRRLTRVEIGGAVLTGFTIWTLTGKPGFAVPAGAVAAWKTVMYLLPI